MQDPVREAIRKMTFPAPAPFKAFADLSCKEKGEALPIDPRVKPLFPSTLERPLVAFQKGGEKTSPLKVGVVFSGGQAPGGHNVICGLLEGLKALHKDSTLIGFLNGPSGILNNETLLLTEDVVAPYRNEGGFDLIGSGRTKIETEKQLTQAAKTASELRLDGLVIIGGDDSNTNAALLAEHFAAKGVSTTVVGVPKTIDGDLKGEHIEISFGCATATALFSELIGNLCRDALSAKKYTFFVKLMGRSASHIALECALQTHANYTLIGEEVAKKKQTFKDLVKELADVVCKRAKLGKNYGVFLIPEGVIEFIPEFKTLIGELNKLLASKEPKEAANELSPNSKACFESLPKRIREQLLLDRDPHGNVQVSKIETERLFMQAVKEELGNRKEFTGKFSAQPHFLGYEGRSGYPTPFDAAYCLNLGKTAALLIQGKKTGYMASIKGLGESIENWEPIGVPIASMLTLETRKGKEKPVIEKALVELEGAPFKEFEKHRETWATSDAYAYPAPAQYFGGEELVYIRPRTLLLNGFQSFFV